MNLWYQIREREREIRGVREEAEESWERELEEKMEEGRMDEMKEKIKESRGDGEMEDMG